MHPRVLPPEAWRVVRRLVAGGLLEGWTLAGGTGLALQFGHRISEDLDFFRSGSFDPDALLRELADTGKTSVQARSRGTLHAVVDGVRVSFLEAQAHFLFAPTSYRGLMLADPRDIAVMKLVAIGGRGSRKDFVDLYFYLRQTAGLAPLFSLMRRRFATVDYNEYHLLKSLAWFKEAEAEPMPRMLRKVSWKEVKETVTAEVKQIRLAAR